MHSMQRRSLHCLITLGIFLNCAPAVADAQFAPASQPVRIVGSFTLASTNLEAGATKAYRPWFENGTWQGDIIEYDVASDGTRTSDVTVGANPPVNGTLNWSARAAFAANESTISEYWKSTSGRKIITTDGADQVPFLWNALSSEQKIALDPLTADPDNDPDTPAPVGSAFDSPILNFIRGDRSNEYTAGAMRQRFSLLGDSTKSQPVYVGAPRAGYQLSGYPAFAEARKNRQARLYIGSGDGMVHAFNAVDGSEVYAYVPSTLMGTLSGITKRPYAHRYFVDGQLIAGDARISSTWRTVLAGGLGGGAKGLIALDVTDPDLSSEVSATGENKKLIWEKSGADNGLGHIYGRPRVALLPDGHWYVVSGNGYGSADERAELYLAGLSTSATTSIDTGVGSSNGLSAPALVDTDGDSDADIAYAGDLNGNMWKFDLSARTSQKLFAGGSAKPITSAPEVATHPLGGYLVYFGTGSLLSIDDADNTDQQSAYGLWDKPGSTDTIGANALVEQILTQSGDIIIATDNAVDWSVKRGWVVDFPSTGERLTGNPQLRGKRLQFVTNNATGNNWFLQLNWLTGGDSHRVFFDLDSDGDLDETDKVTVASTFRTPVGLSLGKGNVSQPAFARVAGGHDTVLINGLVLPFIESCTGDCIGGLQGGHVDVDTDTELGGSTNSHQHEYDDKYDVTFMDYYDLQPPDGGGLEHVDNVGIPDSTEFVVVLANADLSPGGVITIGTRQWNVVDYQELVQQRLQAWDGVSPLLDEDGDFLVYTMADIASVGGTMQISFNDRAIADGGLHPTATSCVKGQLTISNNRWRNGALNFQLIDKSTILAGASAGNSWVAQNPTDLVAGMNGGGVHANQANPAGFLYESTLFWHYGGPCYGEPDWAESVAEERQDIMVAQLGEIFPNYKDDTDEIDELLSDLENYVCDMGVGDFCKHESGYKSIETQLDAYLGDYKFFLQHVQGNVTTLSTGDAAEVTDVDQDLNPSLGPNFATGRRSWIDIRK